MRVAVSGVRRTKRGDRGRARGRRGEGVLEGERHQRRRTMGLGDCVWVFKHIFFNTKDIGLRHDLSRLNCDLCVLSET